MRFPFPSRAKRKPRTSPTTREPRPSHALPDVLWTSIQALKESADAFPPLKSAVGGAIAVCDIAERAKHSKSDACEIALRTKAILDAVADAVPDVLAIPPPMLQSIERFTVLLADIQCRIEVIALADGLSRLVHLNRNERVLRDIKAQLDDAYQDFLTASALRLEVQQAQLTARQAHFAVKQTHIMIHQRQMALDISKVAAATTAIAPDVSWTLFYSRLVVFLASP
ncbi:hypothetical protein DFH07DRAFT_789859 [Mycena maculata]|uniref:Uncharacterized protein n=1 Tax=Mycena maculata TaxID=230809 RepID=A0AAD7KBE5_9AGAR|nr:hypothetical protein DFH07DRAFT_789859 [Mycena maculata]